MEESMISNDFLGDTVGRLGFGAMRMPVIDGDQSKIDQEQLNEIVDTALAAGVNYFDTAYPYHENMSEIALGKALNRHPRESFYLADKYPGHQIAKTYDPAAIFEEQLQKCGVEYFDFYLLHNIYENSIDVYKDPQWGILDYFIEQKRLGRIRHLGFSSHGRPDNLIEFLDYARDKYDELKQHDPETASLFAGHSTMEFGQIQLNYLDWTLQNADMKCAILKGIGMPIVVMEPLRGGNLAKMHDEQFQLMHAVNPERTPVEWSLRWLQDNPDVKVILSGMSNLEQMKENISYFDTHQPLTQEENIMLMEVAETLKGGVPCTGCRYCLSSCPMQIDIPIMMHAYNDLQFADNVIVSMQMDAVPEGHRASDCINCKACTKMCPQGIDIPTTLAGLVKRLNEIPNWVELCKQRAEAAERSRQ